jgi:hypothetical protein
MFAEDADGPWLDHVEWDQLVEQSIEQFHVARAAILYLVRAVEISEANTARLDRERGITRGALPLLRMDPEDNEIE